MYCPQLPENKPLMGPVCLPSSTKPRRRMGLTRQTALTLESPQAPSRSNSEDDSLSSLDKDRSLLDRKKVRKRKGKERKKVRKKGDLAFAFKKAGILSLIHDDCSQNY